MRGGFGTTTNRRVNRYHTGRARPMTCVNRCSGWAYLCFCRDLFGATRGRYWRSTAFSSKPTMYENGLVCKLMCRYYRVPGFCYTLQPVSNGAHLRGAAWIGNREQRCDFCQNFPCWIIGPILMAVLFGYFGAHRRAYEHLLHMRCSDAKNSAADSNAAYFFTTVH